MSEDRELLNFVKSRLEDGLSREPPRMGEIMREAKEASFVRVVEQRSRRRRLWGTSLAAASVALVCSFAAFFAQTESPSPENTVADVIELLRTADGEASSPVEAASVAEMLLAWQDAPYEAAVAGLVATAE